MDENDKIINKKNDFFPTNFIDSKKWLKEFIQKRLNKFGQYQDAIIKGNNNIFLYHSGISPMMNIGLLTPDYVINEVIKYFDKMDSSEKHKELHNIEGFIRQIIGWREHCRLTYVIAYNKMKNANKLKNKYKIPKSWYSNNPNTGIEPLDNAIHNGWTYGYLHHIERLMIIGSFMLMIGIHPNEAYKWFFHMSCDSYDWNMINNVKIMALYAYPDLYTTKPYIASSNYIFKMSNYKKDGIWDKIWDSLYWEFINKNKLLIKKNPRLSIQIKNYDNKTNDEKISYKNIKNNLIKKLF
jgi:deoxyribodipyrimidine photolyase-related protein